MVGVPAHIVRVDEDMGMDIDEPGVTSRPLALIVRRASVCGQRRRDLDDLAAGIPISSALQPGAGIDHLAVLDQQSYFMAVLRDSNATRPVTHSNNRHMAADASPA